MKSLNIKWTPKKLTQKTTKERLLTTIYLELRRSVEPASLDEPLHEEDVERGLAPAGQHRVVAVVKQGHTLLPAHTS